MCLRRLVWFDASLLLPAAMDAAGPTSRFSSIQAPIFRAPNDPQFTGSHGVLVPTWADVIIHARIGTTCAMVGWNHTYHFEC
jgi:hypothetical protein